MKYYFEKCIVVGTGQFAFKCAKYMHDNYWLDCVYEYGNFKQSTLEGLCKKNSITYIKLLNKEQCNELMYKIETNRKMTLIISASNTYIFPKFITQSSHVQLVNYHPALLTKHLGRNAESWSIYDCDQITGVTWHRVTDEVDHGEVIAERVIELDQTITSIKLMMKQYQVGFELFQGFIEKILKNKCEQKRNPIHYGKMHYSYEKPNNGVLNLEWKEDQISAFLRSMDYSTLNVMGNPFIIENNIKYSWNSYKILDALNNWENIFNDKLIIKSNTLFILKNYHKVDCN
mgnify:CR=1 FL=1